jgi:hypothetical protein
MESCFERAWFALCLSLLTLHSATGKPTTDLASFPFLGLTEGSLALPSFSHGTGVG